jgi:xanthine dehydrogenase YagR molybdenum-binding subunit
LRTASVVTDAQYGIARNNHNPMELPSTVARWDGDRLTVWDKTQAIVAAREAHAEAHGVPVDHVRVISPFVGGAFGSAGQTWPHQVLASFAARVVGKPVKLVLTRQQTYGGVGYRPTSRQRMAIGADRTGRIAAIIHEGRTETARYATYEDGLTASPKFMYASPNMRSTYRVVPLDVNLPTYMRGPVRRRARSRSSRRWTTWRTASTSTPSSCGCATNRTMTSPTACRSPPGVSPNACGAAPTNSDGPAASRRRARRARDRS